MQMQCTFEQKKTVLVELLRLDELSIYYYSRYTARGASLCGHDVSPTLAQVISNQKSSQVLAEGTSMLL
jgi:hypothetical protein